MKIIPGNIAELLTPVALAFWCASDATFNRGAVVLCTDSFTAAEVDILRSILLTKYGINSTRFSNSSGKEHYRIRIAKSSMPTLQALYLTTSLNQCDTVLAFKACSFLTFLATTTGMGL